jgi:hypothetical protein
MEVCFYVKLFHHLFIVFYNFQLIKDQVLLYETDVQLLDSTTQRKFATWKQILQAGVDAILILEHSFYLSQQNHPQPVSFAAQKYIASNTPAGVGKAIEGIFKQYNKVSDDSKVDMIFKVIIENHMDE